MMGDLTLLELLAMRGIPVFESNLIPLHRIYPPTGAVMENRLCVRVAGRMYFHPQRLAEFKAALLRPPAPSHEDLARWADDGGATP